MKKIQYFEYLGGFLQKNPRYIEAGKRLAEEIGAAPGEEVDFSILIKLSRADGKLYAALCEYIADRKGDAPTLFRVRDELPEAIKSRMRNAEDDPRMRGWAAAVRDMPAYTLPLPTPSRETMARARSVWKETIYGNEEILKTVLRHAVEYGKTGRTVPLLLVGEPGVGKTAVSRTYGRIMGLPMCFYSGPSISMNRGLAGDPNVYVGAGCGVIAEAMANTGAGNPVICVDELDKALGGRVNRVSFQDEMLAALDESSQRWRDNFLEVVMDASHIPFIFTANETDSLPAPLLDRVEVIRMDSPTRDMIFNITRDYTLPEAIKTYQCPDFHMEDKDIGMLVDSLWDAGNNSCRPYQKATKMLVSNAYMRSLEEDSPVYVSEADIRLAVEACVGKKNRMGFK